MTLFELILKLQGYPISKAQKLLDEIAAKPTDELYQWQDGKKWEIFDFHYQNNQFYKNFIGGSKPEKWEDIPVMYKKDLQRPLAEMLAKGYHKKNVYLSSTSGSSGHPFLFAKDKFSHAMAWALI